MATEILAGPLGEIRAASTAGGGTALTTTAGFIQIPTGVRHLMITPRNFSTGVVAQIALNPYLVVIKTADALATAPTDYSENAQDGSAATDVTLSSLDTAANLDFLYVGSHLPFRGVVCDIDAANGTASVLTVKYWQDAAPDAWTDITATDGTTSGGATFAVDGNVTWTVPTDWLKASLLTIADTTLSFPYAGLPMYWTRWEVSVALDSSTTLNSMLSMNRSTAYWELLSGQPLEERITKGLGGIGCVEALMNAGTGNLIVNAASGAGSSFV